MPKKVFSAVDPGAGSGHRLFRDSFEFTTYSPRDTAQRRAAYQRFRKLL